MFRTVHACKDRPSAGRQLLVISVATRGCAGSLVRLRSECTLKTLSGSEWKRALCRLALPLGHTSAAAAVMQGTQGYRRSLPTRQSVKVVGFQKTR